MVLTPLDWYAIPFSVVWLGVAIGFVTQAVHNSWQRSTLTQTPLG
jgi:hypothetical protein